MYVKLSWLFKNESEFQNKDNYFLNFRLDFGPLNRMYQKIIKILRALFFVSIIFWFIENNESFELGGKAYFDINNRAENFYTLKEKISINFTHSIFRLQLNVSSCVQHIRTKSKRSPLCCNKKKMINLIRNI